MDDAEKTAQQIVSLRADVLALTQALHKRDRQIYTESEDIPLGLPTQYALDAAFQARVEMIVRDYLARQDQDRRDRVRGL